MAKYFNTKHKRNSAKLTGLITVILLLLLFVISTPDIPPPETYGVAVNFGNSSFGKGDVQPLKPVKSEPKKIEEPPKPDVSESEQEPVKSVESTEDVLTQENAEEIALKKQKETEAREKAAEEEAKAKAEADRIAKEKREQEEKKKRLDDLIGGVSKSEGATGSEGDDNQLGDKGQLDGNPYAPSYFGGKGSGNGVGYGLNGRGRASFKKLTQNCNESGMVIVRIVVNQSGNVILAEPGQKGTTNTAPCLLEPARKIAMSHKWPANSEAPTRQIGFVSVNFKLSQ